MSMISATLTLFLMMDPIGNVPAFAALLRNVPARRRPFIVLREHLVALITLLFFLTFGPTVMGWLHIQAPALSVAGGVVLFIVALQMIFPNRAGHLHESFVGNEPFIVPLAIPLIAGPSTMAMIMLMVTREPHRRSAWLAALLAAWSASLLILLLANRLRPLLGPRGLVAAERLMGMILLVVAVQMTMTGFQAFFANLPDRST